MSVRKPPLLLVAILAIACGSAQPIGGTGATPVPGRPLSMAELKYRVIEQVGAPFVCGPPVSFADYDSQQAAAQFPAIKADTATYLVILGHAHPAGDESNPAFQLLVWQEWEKLQATRLTAKGPDGYDFNLRTATATVSGSVAADGKVTVSSTRPGRPNCPICLAAGTLIATAGGPIRVTDLHLGDSVWTVAADGSRVEGRVMALGSVAFPLGHDAVRLTLADGRSVTVSPGHPTADGRTVGQLRPGDRLDGATVVSAVTVHLADGGTYDLLPSGPTGRYWADGVLLGSTLWED
jgi:hypothetical protein